MTLESNYVNLIFILILFTAQQKRDYSIAAGLQYEVGDKCQVSDYIEEEKILLAILIYCNRN